MIISRTPLRISFVGGGTDLPSFFNKERGSVVSTTIDKFVYIVLHKFFDKRIQIKYSETEVVDKVTDIKHPVFRECLKNYGLSDSLEIAVIQDLPKEGGSGLGGSTAFSVGLINALSDYKGISKDSLELAEESTFLEIDILKNPIGLQDQYASAYGGLNYMTFSPSNVEITPILLDYDKILELEKNMLMFYTGITRSANVILDDLNTNINNEMTLDSQIKMRNCADTMYEHLKKGDISTVGSLMHENWIIKRNLTNSISTDSIDEIYQTAINCGAEGGKILGAGGGGFFLFYCQQEYQDKLRNELNLPEYKFSFHNNGSEILLGENDV